MTVHSELVARWPAALLTLFSKTEGANEHKVYFGATRQNMTNVELDVWIERGAVERRGRQSAFNCLRGYTYTVHLRRKTNKGPGGTWESAQTDLDVFQRLLVEAYNGGHVVLTPALDDLVTLEAAEGPAAPDPVQADVLDAPVTVTWVVNR